MGALGALLAGDTGAGVIGLGWLHVTMVGEAMLWIAALLTLLTGWDYLIASLRHATAPRAPSSTSQRASSPAKAGGAE